MKRLELFREFLHELMSELGVGDSGVLGKLDANLSPKVLSSFLYSVNEFLYQSYETDGEQFLSKYQAFWQENHSEILDFRIVEDNCLRVASILEEIYRVGQTQFAVSGDTEGLTLNQIANVRYFTIIQDFKIRFRRDPYSVAKQCPNLFDARTILDDFPKSVNELLNLLGADSQTDKRQKFARLCAELLVGKYSGEAFKIAEAHNHSAREIISALAHNSDPRFSRKLGFSAKKAIILVRDMIDLGVWKIEDPENLDVPSDINTMRVALRTGILTSRVPLLASYLDVYCYQYGETDRMCRQAWRRVWERWGELPNNHRLPFPASFDYLLFNVGKNWNKPDKMPEVKKFRGISDEEHSRLNPPKSISIYGRTGWESGRTNDGGGGGIMA
jgi:hypothetical protein